MANSFFTPYQTAWITDDSPMKISEKSRRVGITYGTSYRSNQKCLKKPAGFTQWLTSRDLLTAKEFVTDYLAKWAKAANVVATGLDGIEATVVDEDHGIKAFVVEYETGNRVVSLSSTPEAFAGKGGDVLIDEADLHKDSGKLIDMAMPCTTWGGQLEIVSAYRVDGSRNTPFAKLVSHAKGENSQGWSLHVVTVDDAIAQGIVEKINEVTGKSYSREEWRAMLRARCRNEAAWLSQYMCQPQDDGGALLTYDLIGACEDPALNNRIDQFPDPSTIRGSLYLGMDIARKRHFSVIWINEHIGPLYVTRYVKQMHNELFRNQKHELYRCLRLPHMSGACIDATGIGMNLAEDAELDFGAGLVESVMFTLGSKNQMGVDLKTRFEDRQLLIPENNTIREDLHMTEKVVSASGNSVRLVATEDDEGHADRFWSLALADRAARSLGASGYFAPTAAASGWYPGDNQLSQGARAAASEALI